MYRSIVLAYDGSPEGRAALREGALMARRLGAQVGLLCVLSAGGGMQVGETVHNGAIAHLAMSHQHVLNEALKNLSRLGVRAVGRLVMGDPAKQIAAFAAEMEADLVVVGHRRRSLLDRWWSGENGAYLVDHIGCSLLVARNMIGDAEVEAEIVAQEAVSAPA